MTTDLDRLSRAYRRLAGDTGSRFNFACDTESQDAVEIAEEERNFLDQAFFVLIFGVLENQINTLALARQTDGSRRAAMRDAPFKQRFDAAVKVANEEAGFTDASAISQVKDKILNWYDNRSDIAHGNASTKLLDIVGLLAQAKSISTLLSKVQDILLAKTALL